MRNRVSAQQARERKKAYLNDLEMKVKDLEKSNSELEERLSTLQNENQMLRHVCHLGITWFYIIATTITLIDFSPWNEYLSPLSYIHVALICSPIFYMKLPAILLSQLFRIRASYLYLSFSISSLASVCELMKRNRKFMIE